MGAFGFPITSVGIEQTKHHHREREQNTNFLLFNASGFPEKLIAMAAKSEA